jgi:hypothetical protein
MPHNYTHTQVHTHACTNKLTGRPRSAEEGTTLAPPSAGAADAAARPEAQQQQQQEEQQANEQQEAAEAEALRACIVAIAHALEPLWQVCVCVRVCLGG